MGRIGDERAFAFDGLLEPGQQIVQCGRDWSHLIGQAGAVQRIELAPLAAAQGAGELAHGTHGTPDDPYDQSRERRQQERERRDRPQREVRGALLADVHRLRHLDDATVRLDPNTRQRPLGVAAVDSPSVVSPGSTVCGRER